MNPRVLIRLSFFSTHAPSLSRHRYLINAKQFIRKSFSTYCFPRHFSRRVIPGRAALKPGMLQHVRRRRTVRRAVLHHGDDQIPKGIQARLREPHISRPKRIYSPLQYIPNTPILRRSRCNVSATQAPKRIWLKYDSVSTHRHFSQKEYDSSIPLVDLQRC